MKNKKTAYFMVPIVLAIWGMIGWKVYIVMKGKNDGVVNSKEVAMNKTVAIVVSDTISLIANYRDPFLDRIVVAAIVHNQKSTGENKVKVAQPIVKVEVVWPKISYHGLIKKSGMQKIVGFLNINGKSYFVQMGQEVEGVKVGNFWKDSVELSFSGKKMNFRK